MTSAAPVKLYLPCEVFSVRAVVGPSRSLSQIEQLILRAVHAGANTLPALELIFGIGARPMLRLVLSHINRGHLEIDYENGMLRVGTQVEEAIEDKALGALDSVDVAVRPIRLAYDLVAGTVQRVRRTGRLVRSGYTVEPQRARGSYRKLEKSTLMRAADEVAHRWTTPAGQPLKVIELGLELGEAPTLAGSGEQFVLELEVRANRDSATDFLQLAIVRPDDLGALVQRRLETELTRLANLPDPPLALKNLRDASLVSVPETSLGLGERVAELRILVARLAGADPGTYHDWQRTLAQHAEGAELILAEQGARSLEHRVIRSQDEQVDLIRKMIGRARRQLVLAGPFLGYEAVVQYRSEIEEALRRGVRVFVLWGITSSGSRSGLGTGLSSWFGRLEKEFPNGFFRSEMPANVHAKFVVGDASELFVTSYNFLNRKPNPVFELGVWIAAARTSRQEVRSAEEMAGICFPALCALSVAKEVFPDLEHREGMLVNAVDFGGGERAPNSETGGWPDRVRIDGADPAVVRQIDLVWRQRWEDYVSRLASSVSSLGTTFEIVRDAQHHQILYDAFRSAKHRVVVLSDRLNGRVVNRRFLDELSAALGRAQLRVALICHQPQPDPLQALRELEARFDGRLLVRVARAAPGTDAHGESHAKVLVADDAALVTSYNFLSFGDDGAGAERYALSTELGVSLRGGSGADAVMAELSRQWPELAALATAVEPPAEPVREPVPPPAGRDVEQLLHRLARVGRRAPANAPPAAFARKRARILKEWFGQARSSCMEALRELEYIGVAAPPFMDQVIAACLDVWGSEMPPDAREWWTRELLDFLWWERLDPMGILVLLDADGQTHAGAAIPPRDLVELAAYRHLLRRLPPACDDLALKSIDSGEQAARNGLAALLVANAVFDDEPALDPLTLLAEHLEGGIGAWARAAVRFRNAHLDALSPRELSASTDVKAAGVQRDELHAKLDLEMTKTRAFSLNLKVFKLAWAHLERGEMGFKRLHEAVVEHDAAHVAEFVRVCRERYGTGRDAAGRMLDTAIEEGAANVPEPNREIFGKRRRLCLSHLDNVLKYTREWVKAMSTVDPVGQTYADEALGELSLAISTGMPLVVDQLHAAIGSRRYDAPLLRRMVDELEPLAKLGGAPI